MQSFESNNVSIPIDTNSFPATALMSTPSSLLSEFNTIFDTFFSGVDCEPLDNYPQTQSSSTYHPILQPAPNTAGHSSSHRQRSATPVSTPMRKTRARNLRKEQRKQALQNDEYVLSFERTAVTCAGCRKIIQLDSRNGARYYPRAFKNHKKVCSGVRDGMVCLDI